MNVLALNSSPRDSKESKTQMMLAALVDGMRQAGAEVEIIELRRKKIKNCIGCFTCWTKTPGQCIHKDDMSQELFAKWLAADLVIYATPLYHYTINALMKRFIERTLPAVQPFFEQQEGQTGHPWRQPPPDAVVLAVAGLPQISVFDQLSGYVRYLFDRFDRGKKLLAEIYRPAAESLAASKHKKEDVLAATARAGHELVTERRVAAATLERIQQPVIKPEIFEKIGNLYWKTCIAEGVTPRTFSEKDMRPRPDSIETFMLIFPMGFKAEAAAGVTATIQFNFSGRMVGACFFVIADGRITATAGRAPQADLTIATPFDVWMDIMTGKADGQQMLAAEKYQVAGDIQLLMKLGEYFGS